MLQLRRDHMDAFAKTAEDNFIDRTCLHLRQVLPRETSAYSDDALHDLVRRDAARARVYGLTWERSIVRFAEATLLLGPAFDLDPRYDWAQMILRNQDFGQDQRSLALVMCAHQAAVRQAPGGDS